ncbi:hypothetical protein B0H19DRAFT_1058942 [Mycena capillaripes]|nr:hypothetical protein B0H19DRAFT_1058942 [Mycena capillaripes]
MFRSKHLSETLLITQEHHLITQVVQYPAYQRGGKAHGKVATECPCLICMLAHSPNAAIRALGSVQRPDKWTAEVTLYIWFAKQLALGHTNTSLWLFTAKDCEQERSVVLNHLTEAIHAGKQAQNVEQLSSITGRSPPGPHQHNVAKSVRWDILHAAVTDVNRTQPLKEWHADREKRLNMINDTQIFFKWFEVIYDDEFPEAAEDWDPPFPGTVNINRNLEFCMPRDQLDHWTTLANQTCNYTLLFLPAHLTRSPIFYPSPLFPHQQALKGALRLHIDRITALYFQPHSRHGLNCFGYILQRYTNCMNLGQFYRQFLGTAPGKEPFCTADEEFFMLLPTIPQEISTREQTKMH